MGDLIMIPCRNCGSEGRIYRDGGLELTPHGIEPITYDEGPCPVCEGTGREIAKCRAATEEDVMEHG